MSSGNERSINRLLAAGLAFALAFPPVTAKAETSHTARELEVSAPGIRIRISKAGCISEVFIKDGTLERTITAETLLAGCTEVGQPDVRTLAPSGAKITRSWRQDKGHGSCQVIERFFADARSIRWQVEVLGDGGPWTAPIETRLAYPASETGAKVWAPWSDPCMVAAPATWGEPGQWADPLVARDFADGVLYFGAVPFHLDNPLLGFMPMRGDLFSVPMVSILEESNDAGLSIALSPEDPILDLALEFKAGGSVAFSRMNHRISRATPVRFSLDLVPQRADWRDGMRWMTERYAAYFDPPNPAADAMAGTGAYSSYEGPIDEARMRAMAFRVNWMASFDFPYMGMFIPPVAAANDTWGRYGGGTTSVSSMEAYARRMRSMGFYVLSYFSITEFGAHVMWPPSPGSASDAEDLWKDCNAFLFGKLAGAILHIPSGVGAKALPLYGNGIAGGPYYTWEGGIAMDCGDPAYKAFLLEQVRRHIARLPDASGFAVDRMDWLRLYNLDRDDGLSWFDGQPAASLLNSWKAFMREMGPLAHDAGKVIFVNTHDKRLDVMRDADGIFDEFSYDGRAMNLNAFLTLRKPAIGWTVDEKVVCADPDAYFQRCLYLGDYPMAPFPGNDHAILPSAWADKEYTVYGSLLDMIRGKKWVLGHHPVSAVGGTAKVNLFEVQGGAYAVPVTFAGDAKYVDVLLDASLPVGHSPKATAWLPGESSGVPVGVVVSAGQLRLHVPVACGCSVVRISAR